MRTRILSAARAGTFARAGQFQESFGRQRALRRVLRRCAALGRWCAREMRPPSDSGNPIHRLQMKKPAAGFPGRAFVVLAMMKICR